jgi:flagella basal body P-ring formation protein FlgA
MSAFSLAGRSVAYGDGSEIFMKGMKTGEGDRYPWSYVTMEPETFGVSGVITAPEQLFPGIPSVTIRVRDGAGRIRANVFRLSWFAPMVFATRDLRRGDLLLPDSMAVRVAAYSRAMGEVFSSSLSLEGKRVLRRVRSGEIISDRDVERVPVIDRGDPVIILSRAGNVMARLKGKALEAGSLGDRIRVRATMYREDLLAEVQGRGSVLVVEGE